MGRGRVALAAVAAVVLAGCSDGSGTTGTASPGPTAGPGQAPSSTVDPAAVAAANAAAVLSPLALRALDPPAPVVGSDGLRHYAYELTVVNQGTGTATLESVQALDATAGTPVGAVLSGDALAELFRLNGGADDPTPVLGPGQSGTLFLDLTTPAADPVPTGLRHEVDLSYAAAPAAPEPGDLDPTPAPPQDVRFTGVATEVDQQEAVVVDPPLRGGGWVVGNGCCDPINAHRGSTLSLDGDVAVAQRFAIDFVRLAAGDQAVTGDPADLTSYPDFGQEVHSATAGTVVDAAPAEREEQVPGALPAGATVQTADGNYLVVDMGGGRFAFYAHMQPGSLRKQVGDTVAVGEVLGLLGNTGNTDAPHLHFHVMDGPSPLLSNGLPFRFSSFTGQGVVTDLDPLTSPRPGVAVPVAAELRAGPHAEQMPLGSDVVSFPG